MVYFPKISISISIEIYDLRVILNCMITVFTPQKVDDISVFHYYSVTINTNTFQKIIHHKLSQELMSSLTSSSNDYNHRCITQPLASITLICIKKIRYKRETLVKMLFPDFIVLLWLGRWGVKGHGQGQHVLHHSD